METDMQGIMIIVGFILFMALLLITKPGKPEG
jgi:hypothetical protein